MFLWEIPRYDYAKEDASSISKVQNCILMLKSTWEGLGREGIRFSTPHKDDFETDNNLFHVSREVFFFLGRRVKLFCFKQQSINCNVSKVFLEFPHVLIERGKKVTLCVCM